MTRIGIDLGGSKIEILALDAQGKTLLNQRVATPAGDYAGTVATVAALVREADAVLGTQGSVGVGSPGAISPLTGRMKNCNSTCLNGQPLKEDLERILGRPVRLANDADCFALSEAADGAAAGANSVFGVILGTGVGGGIVVNGRLLSGPNAIAGEWGHNPLPRLDETERAANLACYCGRRNCVETWLSGPGLAADHARVNGAALSATEITRAAMAGEPAARATLDRYMDRLARALAGIINVLDPEVIVLGGGMSNIPLLYAEVPRRWAREVFSDGVATRLVPPRHGDASGVRGAAWLWPAA
jgi:fructokinase